MSDYQDNPKLTAYALGEADPSDIQQIEAMLAGDADARAYVESIRQTADVVTTSLQDEMQSLPLSPIKLKTSRPRTNLKIFIAAATAACVAFTAGLMSGRWTESNRKTDEIALLSDTPDILAKTRSLPAAAVPAPTPGDATISSGFKLNTTLAQPTVSVDMQITTVSGLEKAIKTENSTSLTSSPEPGAVSNAPLSVARNNILPQMSIAAAPQQRMPDARGKLPFDANDSVILPSEIDGVSNKETKYGTDISRLTEANRDDASKLAMINQQINELQIDLGSNHERVRKLEARAEQLQKRMSGQFNTESYDRQTDNEFMEVVDNPLSTFSVDVDTASYSNIRRFLTMNQLPPKDAVRIEEMVNYFSYDYPQPTDGRPFATAMELASCPWNEKHQLLRIAIKGKEIAIDKRPPSNLVFLLDVSGSMSDQNKLPLVKQSMKALLSKLGENDRIAIVVYAGSSGLVLSSTSAMDKARIAAAIDELSPGGSTNGAQGIELAYAQAAENFIKDGTNRVILCTDGDFNVGITDQGSLTRLIEDKAKFGVFLSVLGFGMGNTKDSTMEKLADKGNGNYAYIDTLNEARKVLVEQMTGTLITIAKDVKLQLEFNPAKVSSYRLIGYENRVLAKEDFNNDKKDAGEIGAGHTVTALYEITPAGEAGTSQPAVDPLKYQKPAAVVTGSNELLTLKLRYKKPDADKSELIEFTLKDAVKTFSSATKDFQFASAVAGFGMILRDSPYKGTANLGAMLEVAQSSKGEDLNGYRAEFIELIKKAQQIKR